MKIWHFPALAGVFVMVGACSGTTSIGGGAAGAGGDDEGGETGGGGSSGMPTGGRGGSATGGDATGGMGTGGGTPNPCAGKPCGAACGMCGWLGTGGTNMSDPGGAAPCPSPVLYCDANGECGNAFPVCENQCETSMDCPVVDLPCQMCADGSTVCPSAECVMGQCVSSFPTCAAQCMSDAECPVPMGPCQMCPDGTASCPKAECVNGRCTTGWPGCGGVDPCAGRECGEACSPCTDMDCGMSDTAFACNIEGKCAAEAPRCEQCMTTMDCPQMDICYMCLGGTCGTRECVNGGCEWVCPPGPEPECMSAMDCTADTICRICPDMTCAVVECLRGECVSVCGL